MRNHDYPITVYKQKSFGGWIERLPQMPPLSFFLAIFFLLSGFTAAAGYFVQPPGSASKGLAENNLSLRPSHTQESPALPGTDAGAGGKQRFAFAAGMEVLDKNFKDKQKIAREVGLPFHMEIANKRVTMTRLYLGTFPLPKGMALYDKIKKKFPGTFVIQNWQEQTVAVFGGSFYYPEAARKEKRRLAKAGYTVHELPSRVELPLYAAYIGDFESTHDAEAFRQHSSQISAQEMPLVAIH